MFEIPIDLQNSELAIFVKSLLNNYQNFFHFHSEHNTVTFNTRKVYFSS